MQLTALRCPACGGGLNPDGIDWGPAKIVRCSYCSTSVGIEQEGAQYVILSVERKVEAIEPIHSPTLIHVWPEKPKVDGGWFEVALGLVGLGLLGFMIYVILSEHLSTCGWSLACG